MPARPPLHMDTSEPRFPHLGNGNDVPSCSARGAPNGAASLGPSPQASPTQLEPEQTHSPCLQSVSEHGLSTYCVPVLLWARLRQNTKHGWLLNRLARRLSPAPRPLWASVTRPPWGRSWAEPHPQRQSPQLPALPRRKGREGEMVGGGRRGGRIEQSRKRETKPSPTPPPKRRKFSSSSA